MISLIHDEPDRPTSRSLRPAFDGQDVSALLTLLGGVDRAPNLKLVVEEIDNGFVVLQPGLDGAIFTADGTAVQETLLFRGAPDLPDKAALAAQAVRLDFAPFVAIDCSWFNYYHWLCLAVPKMLMSRHIRGLDARPVLPDHAGHAATGWRIAFSETVWQQSLTMTEVADDAVRLAPGVYTADRIVHLRLDHPQPAFLSFLPDFDLVFDAVRAKLTPDPASPKRILVARRNDQRIADADHLALDATARRYGLVKVDLEDLDFVAQAQLFFNAEAVVATHGAGLSNLVFGRSSLRVLELNQLIGGDRDLRPWFYLLAMARHQTYFFLNGSRGEFAEPHLRSAFDRLCSRLPLTSRSAPWWSLR